MARQGKSFSQLAQEGNDIKLNVDWSKAFNNGEESKLIIEDVIKYEEALRKKLEEDVQKQRLEFAEELAKEMADLEIKNGKMSQAQKIAYMKNAEKERLKQQTANAKSSKELKQLDKQSKKDEKEIAQLQKLAEWQEKLAQAQEDKNAEDEAAAQAEIDAIKLQMQRDENNAKLQQNLLKGVSNAINEMGNEVNSMISSFASYQSAINTRLEGTNESFNSLRRGIIGKMGSSPFVKTQKVLESLQSLVSEGISFNLEQRTFLASLSDKIATTFEIANDSLLKIVRLQQADSSAARLGMESYLTRYLNSMFQNTEYLNSNFDAVTAALLEASAHMEADKAVEFEFAVQKWLGALSSVGLTDNTVSGLAQAIGWLGTGNVEQLTSSPLNNLIVMAANRAGLDYSKILVDGLDAATTNKLLESVVEYLQSMAANSNKVVRTQLSTTFGVSAVDLVALANLNADTIDAIAAESRTYADSVNELTYQFKKLGSRVSVPEMLQNLIDNFKFTTASTIAGNPVTSTMWALTDMIQKYTGGINIPAFQTLAMGTGGGFDLNTTVEGLIQTGLIGMGALGGIASIIGGIAGAVNPSGLLKRFGINANSLTTTGLPKAGLGQSDVNIQNEDAVTPEVGNGEDGANTSLDDATKNAEKKQKKKEEDKSKEFKDKTLSDIYFYLMDMLDPKLTDIASMTAVMAGFEVTRTTWDNRGSDEDRWEFKYGTTLKVTPGGENSQTQLDLLDSLNANVDKIYKLLDERLTIPSVTTPTDIF